MKRTTRRLLSLLMAVVLCLGLTPVTAWALEISGDGWEFDLTDMANPTLVINNDTGMDDWIKNGSSYRSIVFAVELTEDITKVPYHAFYKCTNLTAVEIPASVTEMGKNDVFEGCTNLTTITVADGNDNFFVEDGVLYGYEKDDDGNKIEDEFVALICPPGKSGSVTLKDGTVEIGGSAFEDCTKLTGVTLNEGLTRIGSNAFGGCSSLQNVTLPASLTSLGNGVFNGCVGLTSLAVADGNADYSAEDGVLYDKGQTELLLYPAAKSDADFTVPGSVTHIASYAFQGARHLKNVTAGDLTSIESSAFMNCESLTSFSAKSLGEVKLQAFYQCAKLETFTLEDEDSLTTIGGSAFNRCSSLTAAPLAGATSIEEGAFQNCTALTSLSFCETGNVSIGKNAFSGCIGLTELTFPASVTSIGYSAFGGCNQVTVITFESETPPTCDSNSFSIGDPNNFQIVVPNDSENAYIEALGSYVGDTLVKKYPLFVNGQQFTSEKTAINCGSGTASFDVATSTLTLTNATIENMGGDYGYGGAINSGLAELTIKLVGTNTINAEQEQWGTTYRDSINSGTNCDVKIVSGESDGTMPTLVCDLIDMGRGGSGFTGGAGEGNLTVDGVNLTVKDRIFVHHNTTFQNGAQANVTGGLTVNNNATVTVTGETTAVTVKYIALGNNLPGQTNRLVLDSGTLTLTGSVAYPGAPDGDTDPYAIRFDPVSSGSIAINGGMFEKQASCAGTNIDGSKITQAGNLPVQGSWDGGTLIIGPANDDKHAVTVKSDPTVGGVAYGGGRYAENDEVTLTATAQTGWFFIGWYQDNGETTVSVSKSYEYTVGKADVTFTAKFIEDELYQAEQAKETFDKAQTNGNLTREIFIDAVEAYNAVPAFLTKVKGIDGLLADDDKTALYTRYKSLTAYYQSITALDLSNQGISSADLAKLALFTGVTDLNLSGNKGVTSLSNLPNSIQPKTLNLSSTGIADLNSLTTLTNLESLNLSNNKDIVSLTSLSSLTNLETLDISGTGVTTLESLIKEGESRFPGYQNLTAHNLTLTSLSALAGTAKAEGFSVEAITKWDFHNSTLPDTEDSKTDVETIQSKLGNKFIPPTFKTNPTPGGSGGGGAAAYGVAVADCEHGKISAEPAKAAKGDTVTVTVTPEEGFEVRAVNVTDAGGKAVEVSRNADGTFSFVQPAGNVTVSAALGCDGGALCPSAGFPDVDQSLWYHDAVDWAVSSGIMGGFDGDAGELAGCFGPDLELTRAQAAQILWAAEGRPAADRPAGFADVAEGDWHFASVSWAACAGVFEGYDDGSGLFGPDDPLTREQAAAVLMRWAGLRGMDTSARADLSAYPDGGSVSEWARGCMSWAVAAGVVSGVEQPDGTRLLDAQGTSSRAVAATLMMRLVG
ncbi:leucine-rich repeat protein [Collinsella tanakaei]|nr:leucine-rich repeat protein [Collinsella tanakaei]